MGFVLDVKTGWDILCSLVKGVPTVQVCDVLQRGGRGGRGLDAYRIAGCISIILVMHSL